MTKPILAPNEDMRISRRPGQLDIHAAAQTLGLAAEYARAQRFPVRRTDGEDGIAHGLEFVGAEHCFATAFPALSARPPALRSIPIMPAFFRYQPKNGIHIN